MLECDANVEAIEALGDGNWRIILDKTCMYPGGGGQDFDFGRIEWSTGMMVVTATSKDKDGVVYHDGTIEAAAPQVGDAAHIVVDADRRFLNSRGNLLYTARAHHK